LPNGPSYRAHPRLYRNRHADAVAARLLLRDQRTWLGRGSKSENDPEAEVEAACLNHRFCSRAPQKTIAPRITILSASSCNGRCNAFARPAARASKHRAFSGGQDHGHGFGMDRRDHLFWRLPGQLAHTYERL
jgi:hypothetical protein